MPEELSTAGLSRAVPEDVNKTTRRSQQSSLWLMSRSALKAGILFLQGSCCQKNQAQHRPRVYGIGTVKTGPRYLPAVTCKAGSQRER
jgi:1,2-phenylacetyl-CoA epoxidase PaaB subunit